MPTNYKVLGQVSPSATTATTLYTVPAATEAVISTVVICNRSAVNRTFRLAVRPNGATLSNEHYLAYDITVGLSDSTALTLGITMDAGDVLTVYASSTDLSFSAFGSEITA
jgi:hypothetical protein